MTKHSLGLQETCIDKLGVFHITVVLLLCLGRRQFRQIEVCVFFFSNLSLKRNILYVYVQSRVCAMMTWTRLVCVRDAHVGAVSITQNRRTDCFQMPERDARRGDMG